MHKSEIEKKLKDAWIKKGTRSYRDYETAKSIICPDIHSLLPSEYDRRIKLIAEYLGI